MLPYFEQPALAIGPLRLTAFGAFAAAAVLTGWRLTARHAARLGLDSRTGGRMARLMALGGFAAAAAGGYSSLYGIAGAAVAGFAFVHRTGRARRYFDAAALAFPISWILFRAGCALAHDHPGARSLHTLAVAFPGGGRWDLGLLEMLAMLPVATAFAVLGRTRRTDGWFAALLAIVYGALRLGLENFR